MKCMPELGIEFLSSRKIVENICEPIILINTGILIKWNFRKFFRRERIFENKRWLILDFKLDSIGSIRIFYKCRPQRGYWRGRKIWKKSMIEYFEDFYTYIICIKRDILREEWSERKFFKNFYLY